MISFGIVNLSFVSFNSSLLINISDGPIISDESSLDSINFKFVFGFVSVSVVDRSGCITGKDGAGI